MRDVSKKENEKALTEGLSESESGSWPGSDSTEARILAAAEAEFLDKGLDGARTTAIAARAGVTHAMLHYYFRTKGLLFERIISSKLDELKEMMSTVFFVDGTDFLGGLRFGVEHHFEYLVANPDLPRFMIQEIYSHPDRYPIVHGLIVDVAQPFLGDLQRRIDESAAVGKIVWIDARMLLIDIISLNIFSFMGYPIVKPVLGDYVDSYEDYLEKRKQENVELIMCRLRP